MAGYVNKNKIVDIFDGSLHSNSSPTHFRKYSRPHVNIRRKNLVLFKPKTLRP